MRLDLLERRSEADGPLQRIDARVKLVVALMFVAGVVATPVGAWRVLQAEGLALALLVGLSGVPPRDLFRRWLAFLLLVGFLTAMVAPSHPRSATLGVAAVGLSILAKNSMVFLMLMVLAHVTPFRKLLHAFRRLGAPTVLAATLHFMYRYLSVFGEELDRMVKARRSRSFRRSGRLDWGLLTSLISVLFLRAFERGERVHAAMLARGWDGTVRSLEGPDDP